MLTPLQAHVATKTFYNNTHGDDITGPNANEKCSIHHWSTHGFSGRGVLLDYRSWADSQGVKYDTATSHAISYEDLVKVGKHQGIDIRPAAQGGDIKIGDILLIRSGWVEDYYRRTPSERETLALRGIDSHAGEQCWAGVKQEESIKDWLHDSYFSAVGGDAPSFERWPTPESYYLHEYILALWGMPLGEMLDLEKLSELCKKNKRWTFFVSSLRFLDLVLGGEKGCATSRFHSMRRRSRWRSWVCPPRAAWVVFSAAQELMFA
jgi:hypothetical protein